MLVPSRILSLLLILILIAQILPSTSSYQGGKIATKRRNSVLKREALHMVGGVSFIIVCFRKIEADKANTGGEQILSRRPLSQSGGKDNAEYVAFTADYKSPRHHPPRHN
ncbi:hypothetical protein H5410_019357 [Solanum commersonii]|uniref:Uncharacterized protein n=1 Tax=Solanum commersonii TaxID=4109 RepID=A0A9J5Z9D6_SOLCO|nr:hypothetical protein H5410_019357 [Solanum commersonii]